VEKGIENLFVIMVFDFLLYKDKDPKRHLLCLYLGMG
jgi:hypothetical protein